MAKETEPLRAWWLREEAGQGPRPHIQPGPQGQGRFIHLPGAAWSSRAVSCSAMEAAAASFGWDEALPGPLPQPCILEAQGPGPPGSSRCFCMLCPKSIALQGELDGPAKTRVPSGLRAQPKHLHRAIVRPSHFLKFYSTSSAHCALWISGPGTQQRPRKLHRSSPAGTTGHRSERGFHCAQRGPFCSQAF